MEGCGNKPIAADTGAFQQREDGAPLLGGSSHDVFRQWLSDPKSPKDRLSLVINAL